MRYETQDKTRHSSPPRRRRISLLKGDVSPSQATVIIDMLSETAGLTKSIIYGVAGRRRNSGPAVALRGEGLLR